MLWLPDALAALAALPLGSISRYSKSELIRCEVPEGRNSLTIAWCSLCCHEIKNWIIPYHNAWFMNQEAECLSASSA
jgi:hypothetical protein